MNNNELNKLKKSIVDIEYSLTILKDILYKNCPHERMTRKLENFYYSDQYTDEEKDLYIYKCSLCDMEWSFTFKNSNFDKRCE